MTTKKTYPVAQFKALPDEDGQTGRFEAIVSVFGNVDFQGDRVMPGAFSKSIDSWRESGDPVPVIWSHEWGDPFAHIGYVDPNEMVEIAPGEKANGIVPGLLVRGVLDVDKPFAKQVYDLMRTRRVKEFSFAYDVKKEAPGKDRANELHEVSVIEVGPTLKGANPDTVSLGVKSGLERAAKEQASAEIIAAVTKMGAEMDQKTSDEIIAAAVDLDPDLARALLDGNGVKAKAEGDPKRTKYIYEPIAGTDEAKRDALSRAVNAWAETTYPAVNDERDTWACLVGTFDDHVIVSVEKMASEPEYLSISYTLDDEGNPVLGAPESVEVDVVVTAKAEEPEAKAELKPWHVEERGDEFCVIKDSDGSVAGCHATREDALAQMRALYASESGGAASSVVDEAKTVLEALTKALADAEQITPVLDPEPVPEPAVDEKAFARGYSDGTMSRTRKDDEGAEYERGYDEGVKDRDAVMQTELADIKARLDQI